MNWKISFSPRINRLFRLAVIFISIAILGWIIVSNWRSLQQQTIQFSFFPLALSFFIYTITLVLSAIVWGRMINLIGKPLSWQIHMRSYLISRLGFRLPGPLLQIPGRMLLYPSSLSKKIITFASSLELVLAIASGSMVAIVLGANLQTSTSWIWMIIALGIGGIVIQPSFLHTALRLIKVEAWQPISLLNSLEWASTYIVIWITGGASLFFLISAITPLSIESMPIIIGAWTFSGVIGTIVSFLPFGFGLRELTLTVLFSQVLSPGMAALIAIASRFIYTLFDLLVAGLAYLLLPKPAYPHPSNDEKSG